MMRITANVSYGWMEQDDTFLPITTISEYSTVEGLPRQSLDAQIKTLFANVTFSSRPTKNLDIRAKLIYDDRDNNTPRDVYLYVHNDSRTQSTDADSTDRRYNRPYSLEKLQFKLDAGYRLGMRNKLSLGYEYTDISRDFSEVASNREHTLSIKLSNRSLDYADGWIQYKRSSRDGESNYIHNQQFLEGHDPDAIALIAASDPDALSENDPLLRKFFMSARERDQISAAVNLYPSELVSFSITGKYSNDDYDKTEVGLQKSENADITLDVTYNAAYGLDAYTYITYENYSRNQRGYQRMGGNFPLGAIRDPGSFWTIDTEDDVLTVGAGLKWDIIQDKFNVKIGYTYSHATTEIDPDSTGRNHLPLPDITTELHSISLTGEYALREDMRLRLKCIYDGYRTEDFALDNVTSDTLANVILPGHYSPDHDVNLIGLTYIYNF